MPSKDDASRGVQIRLAREMSLFSVAMIGVGAMIGAGIFVLTGIAAGVAGPALILVFFLNALVTLFTAMSYAELGSCFHDAGGGYLWVKEGLRQPNGFLAGWMSWFAHAVACSLYALGFGAYFGHVLTEGFGIDVHQLGLSLEKSLAVVACILFAVINYRGASETGRMGNVVTLLKLLVIGLFVAFGVAVIADKVGWQVEFTPFIPTGPTGILMAMGLTFIAFQGYEVIAQCSEEVIDPKRNIPRGIFLALAIVIPIYLLVAFVAIGAVSGGDVPAWQYLGEHKEIAMVEASRQFMPGGAVLFLIGGLFSTLSALNATIYSSSRVAFAMARDANLPEFISHVSPRRHTPHFAILTSTVIVVIMALSLPIEDVACAADIMFLLVFMQVNVAVIRLRKTRTDLDRGYTTPFFPVTPIAGILIQIVIVAFLIRFSPTAFLTAAAWIGIGALVHYTYASKREARVEETREALGRLERKEYRILVAVADQESVAPLIDVAIAIARQYDGEIVALTVLEVPFQTPLSTARYLPEVAEKRNVLRLAEHMAEDAGVPCERVIRIAHRLSEAILETAREEGCNFIVLGRSQRPRLVSRVVKSSVEKVMSRAPCHVAVVKGGTRSSVRRIVAAVSDERNAKLALQLLPAFARAWNAGAKVVGFTADGNEARRAEADRAVREAAPPGAEVTMVLGSRVAAVIAEESRPGDVILMGDAEWSGLPRLLVPSLADAVAGKSEQTVILIRAYQQPSGRSLLIRLLTGA
jgi:amino acid transporter/nucleotide-binding universal stress UspA family protein